MLQAITKIGSVQVYIGNKMRAFSIACLALSAAMSVQAGYLGGSSASAYVPTSGGYNGYTGYAPAVAAAPVAVAAPVVTAAAPAVFQSAAPVFSAAPVIASAPTLIPAPAAPVSVGAPQVVAHGPSAPRVHEIHSQSAGRQVRIEEYRGPRQVIRVLEGGQAAPEVIRVQGPPQQGSIIRLVTRGGQNHVQHVVHQNPSVQVINVQKQPAPGPRVIHIVRSPAPAARVEVAHAAPAAPAQIVLQPTAAAETHVVGPSRGADAGFAFAGGVGGGAVLAAAPVAFAAPVAAAPVAVAAGPVVSGPVAFAAPISSGYAPVQQVATRVVNYNGGYTQGDHVKIIKKLH